MKDYLIAALNHQLKTLLGTLRNMCFSGITQHQSLPAFPDIEWELHGQTHHRKRIRTLARFFFLLGCLILSLATSIYLWQSLSFLKGWS